jgi:hypothetical protein
MAAHAADAQFIIYCGLFSGYSGGASWAGFHAFAAGCAVFLIHPRPWRYLLQ